MPLPNHSILPVSSLDLPTLADFIHSSKLALTINRLLFKDWPNDAAQKPIYMNAVESAFKNPSIECLKIVEDKSGYIVGYLVLSRKRPPNTEQRTDKESGNGKQDVPAGFVKDVYIAVMSVGITIAREMEGIDHLEVTYICVKLSSRRQGIGSQLMQVCFERAKAEGVPLSLCAEPVAHEFFVKAGFRDTRHVDMDLSNWASAYTGFGTFRLYGMVWSHQGSAW